MLKPYHRIDFLDYLRIFAIGSVLTSHFLYDNILALSDDGSLHIAVRQIFKIILPICWGMTGVAVFFLISGYIITHVLMYERNTKAFVIKRFFRILPLYVLAIVMEAISIWYSGGGFSLGRVFLSSLLIGDFIGLPPFLRGVEWTLRFEVFFYLMMAYFHTLGVIEKSTAKWLPGIYVLWTLGIGMLDPFPMAPGYFSYGYFTLFFPFLFIGSVIYLVQCKTISPSSCALTIVTIVLFILIKSPSIDPVSKDSHSFALGLIIFIFVWGLRDHFTANFLVTRASALTYPVYLFHYWTWPYLFKFVKAMDLPIGIPYELQMLVILLVICEVLHLTIENWGITQGRKIASHLGSIETVHS